tara:strand:- start:10942 stop:11313 length:372 start_codon:yes stop_codon:yes gene_type:complete
MTWIIIRQPHPLDIIWSKAFEDVSDAQSALDALGDDYTNAQADAATDAITAAIQVIMALPARTLSDSLIKLDLAGVDGSGDSIRCDCDVLAIMNEATGLLDAGIARGSKLMSVIPDLLEGVDL